MAQPLVSVVIPSYQHVAYVQRAVESVLAQTVQDIEVIVVDDASIDGTPDVVERIRDRRLRLVRLTQNRREHARNLGLSLASGRYVAFQNSDDEWLPTKLARQLEVLEAREDIGVCFTEVALMDAKGQPAQGTWAHGIFADGATPRSANEWLSRLFFGNSFCIVSSMARRHLVEQVGRFRASLVQLSDLDLWIRLLSLSELFIVAEPLTLMRIDGARNLSAPTRPVITRSAFEMADILQHYVRSPLIDRVVDIFPQLADAASQTIPVRQALIARAAGQHSARSHHLFADRVLARLIDDPDHRAQLVALFGADVIQFFFQNRTRLGSA